MNIAFALEDRLIHGASTEELQRKLRTGLIVIEYLEAELSLGEVAELLEMSYQETLHWLNALGIPTSHAMSPELEALSLEHLRRLIKERESSTG